MHGIVFFTWRIINYLIIINFSLPSSRFQVPVVPAIDSDFLFPLPSVRLTYLNNSPRSVYERVVIGLSIINIDSIPFCMPFRTASSSLVEVRLFASLFLQDPHHPSYPKSLAISQLIP